MSSVPFRMLITFLHSPNVERSHGVILWLWIWYKIPTKPITIHTQPSTFETNRQFQLQQFFGWFISILFCLSFNLFLQPTQMLLFLKCFFLFSNKSCFALFHFCAWNVFHTWMFRCSTLNVNYEQVAAFVSLRDWRMKWKLQNESIMTQSCDHDKMT